MRLKTDEEVTSGQTAHENARKDGRHIRNLPGGRADLPQRAVDGVLSLRL